MATKEQMAALTVPATLKGVVGPFTPILPPDSTKGHFCGYVRGCALEVIVDTEDVHGNEAAPELFGDVTWVYKTPRGATLPASCDSIHLKGWTVDLTEATGRVHLDWALAKALGIPTDVGGGIPIASTGFIFHPDFAIDAWVLATWNTHYSATFAAPGRFLLETRFVPGLEALDIHDGTLLLDGSRWVEAEARRIVALHVLGGAA